MMIFIVWASRLNNSWPPLLYKLTIDGESGNIISEFITFRFQNIKSNQIFISNMMNPARLYGPT